MWIKTPNKTLINTDNINGFDIICDDDGRYIIEAYFLNESDSLLCEDFGGDDIECSVRVVAVFKNLSEVEKYFDILTEKLSAIEIDISSK